KLGVRVIPGCEFSVRAPWGELHVLALFLPHENERLQTFLRDTRGARRRRGEQIVAKLQGLGVAIDLEDVEAQLSGGDGIAGARRHGISRGAVWHGESEHGESHAPLGGMRVPDTWLEPLERRLELTARKRNE